MPRGDAASVVWALDQVAEAAREEEGYDRAVRADLLLIVDQLDELFAADVSEEERDGFAKAIAALVATGRVWVIATLRTDLYERLQQTPALLGLKQKGAAYDLAPPGAAELAEIVRKPAEAAGLLTATTRRPAARSTSSCSKTQAARTCCRSSSSRCKSCSTGAK